MTPPPTLTTPQVVLSQFNKLPLTTLKVAAAAVNCDDVNDHRKYAKKNTLTCALLSDPSKRFMDAVKVRPAPPHQRLDSAPRLTPRRTPRPAHLGGWPPRCCCWTRKQTRSSRFGTKTIGTPSGA